MDLQLLTTCESVQADTSRPSEMEITREIGCLKLHKANVPDGLAPFLQTRCQSVNIGVNKTTGINLGNIRSCSSGLPPFTFQLRHRDDYRNRLILLLDRQLLDVE